MVEIVDFAPGEISQPHRHNADLFVYVLEGSITPARPSGLSPASGTVTADPTGDCSCFYYFFMAIVVIRYETKTAARRALAFIVRIFVNDTIAVTV